MAEYNLGPFRIRPRGEYKSDETYKYLDVVSYNGGSYLCTNNDIIDDIGCTGVEPTNSAYWMQLASKGETGKYEIMYHTIKNLNEFKDSVWDFNETDKIYINNDFTDILEIINVKPGYCGAILTKNRNLKLPINSNFSMDFNYVNIVDENQNYLYTFIYADMGAGEKFIWNRTVINNE